MGKISGGLVILKAFGFVEDKEANKLVLENFDGDLFKKGLDLVKAEL